MDTTFLKKLNLEESNKGTSTGSDWYDSKDYISSFSPADGKLIGKVGITSNEQYNEVVAAGQTAFEKWRLMPAPQRGEIVRQIGNVLRENKHELGSLVSYEMGKIYQEGLGEVQEMIDICDFAVGLSRQLYGFTMHSERPVHRMYEQWHPLGITGIITAFNFPVAVWAWNAMIAMVCGNTVIWKPSEKTPLCAVVIQKLMKEVLKKNDLDEGIINLVNGDYKVGEWLTKDPRVALISATGSIRMGKIVAQTVGERLGKTILELGGNNALIISDKSNRDLALMAVLFGAVGTAGQRCTSTRRVFIQEDVYDSFLEKLIKAYKQLRIGHPLDEKTHVGPLIDKDAVNQFLKAQKTLKSEGGKILYGGELAENAHDGFYVTPCIAEAQNHFEIVQEETFAPILYIMKYKKLEEAIQMQNGVKQGLSSAIFTDNLQEAETFLSHAGSDCGIANVNIGTSGAEIGGAFGGEKETGGGREAGSDAWKAYMRRQTNTINYSKNLPLAQGIKFDI
ncbi:MAG: aldehyde dehydrogenase family protein [Chitinophagaceae bacterium]|nr:MAG: aldehyde dehydrogenase family protein [Chitinophagaceae bacterium]